MPPNEPTPPHPLRYPELAPLPAPMRKRMKRYEDENSVRFLTFSCQRRLPLLTDPLIAAHFVRTLAEARRERQFELFAYVVMPEHVHLLLRPHTGDTVAALLKSVKLSVTQWAINRWRRGCDPLLEQIQTETGEGPRFWQKGGGFDRNVRDLGEFSKEVCYTHQNPVERGLVKRATDYPWSSVHQWLARHEERAYPAEPGIDPPPGKDHDWIRWRGFMVWEKDKAPSNK